MNRRTKIGPNRDITGDACAWLAQLETGELTPADRDAFREWMHRNPLHVREIRRLAALSKNLNVLTGMTDSLEQANDHYEFVLKRRERFGF
ncbi:FecR/PupR family sigma factor regulator, partial [Marivita sp.]|uniref:FecR/PupR family sigma factor regulator n=1 Tax=Marivita sp. TaxID=2003365 RepID=UPI0025C61C4E